MPKKTSKRRSYRKKRSTSKRNNSSRRYRKKRSALAKGPTFDKVSEKVNCCMCGKEILRVDGLLPEKCYSKNGSIRAHRICNKCWWDPVKGFAKEGINHACPGCVKGLPLNGPPIDTSIVYEISDD